MYVLGIHLYQGTSWQCCERLRLGLRKCFWRTLSFCLPISWWVTYECTCPHHAECSAVLDQKWHDPCAPPSLITWPHPKWLCCCCLKKVLKGKCFVDVEEVKQKMADALKGSRLMSSKTVLSSGKNVSIGVLHQMESTLKVTEVWTCRNNYTLFYKWILFWGVAPRIHVT